MKIKGKEGQMEEKMMETRKEKLDLSKNNN